MGIKARAPPLRGITGGRAQGGEKLGTVFIQSDHGVGRLISASKDIRRDLGHLDVGAPRCGLWERLVRRRALRQPDQKIRTS